MARATASAFLLSGPQKHQQEDSPWMFSGTTSQHQAPVLERRIPYALKCPTHTARQASGGRHGATLFLLYFKFHTHGCLSLGPREAHFTLFWMVSVSHDSPLFQSSLATKHRSNEWLCGVGNMNESPFSLLFSENNHPTSSQACDDLV